MNNNNVICLHKSCANGAICAYKKKLQSLIATWGKDWANDYHFARQFHSIYPVACGCTKYKEQ